MKRAVVLAVILGLAVLGAAKESSAQGAPVLEKAWVSPELNYGDVLKVYIKASDQTGNMRYIHVVANAKGKETGGTMPIYLRHKYRNAVNGFVYFNTKGAKNKTGEGTIDVYVEDWKGNASQVISLPMKMVASGGKVQKPPADFQELAIGPIMTGSVVTDWGIGQ